MTQINIDEFHKIFLESKMTIKEATAITGGGIKKGNTKMPFYTYGISAWRCLTGSKLAKVAGSVCSGCYAMRGNYLMFKNVKAAFIKRADSLDHPDWTLAMCVMIGRWSSEKAFRWHDTGDLQSLQHLLNIIKIAMVFPKIPFWLPTRELAIIRKADALVQSGDLVIPDNLTVRISSHFVGRKPWKNIPNWCNTSTVSWKDAPNVCPAPEQEGSCGDCRNCWTKSVKNVDYILH